MITLKAWHPIIWETQVEGEDCYLRVYDSAALWEEPGKWAWFVHRKHDAIEQVWPESLQTWPTPEQAMKDAETQVCACLKVLPHGSWAWRRETQGEQNG